MGAEEFLEHALLFLHGNTDAGILNREDEPLGLDARAQVNLPVPLGIFDGVREEILQDDLEQDGIRLERHGIIGHGRLEREGLLIA